MTDRLDAELRAALGRNALADADEQDRVDDATLDAYARGDLDETAETALLARLAGDPRLTARLLERTDPDGRSEAPASDGDVTAGVDAVLGRVKRPLAGRRTPSTPQRSSPRHDSSKPTRWRRLSAIAAALFLVSSLWLVVRDARHEQRIAELEARLRQPIAGTPVVDLLPPRRLRGPAEESTLVLLSGEASALTLLIAPPEPPTGDGYRLELVDAEGGELWQGPARADAAGIFALVVPRALLSGGERFMVRLQRDGEAVAEYPLVVRQDPSSTP